MVRCLCCCNVGVDDRVEVRDEQSGPTLWTAELLPRVLRIEPHTLSDVVPIQTHVPQELREEPLGLVAGLVHEGAGCHGASEANLAPVVPNAGLDNVDSVRSNHGQKDILSADLVGIFEGEEGIFTDEAIRMLRALCEQVDHFLCDSGCELNSAALHHRLEGPHRSLQGPPPLCVWQERGRCWRRIRVGGRVLFLGRTLKLFTDVA
mmetsp:Transcript_89746/g.187498  ORF Transcript_89746/g.187498 Transcript_89746/m.187498 type:complete len:206 (-) Transcript_89746:517-1134(-)